MEIQTAKSTKSTQKQTNIKANEAISNIPRNFKDVNGDRFNGYR